MIDRMEAAGLVGRTVDPDDRRANRLRLTGRGTAVLTEALPPHLALVKEMMGRLRTAELDTLHGLLERLDPGGEGGERVRGCG
jgi:DNA-binding MarR family transcriptional regulator